MAGEQSLSSEMKNTIWLASCWPGWDILSPTDAIYKEARFYWSKRWRCCARKRLATDARRRLRFCGWGGRCIFKVSLSKVSVMPGKVGPCLPKQQINGVKGGRCCC